MFSVTMSSSYRRQTFGAEDSKKVAGGDAPRCSDFLVEVLISHVYFPQVKLMQMKKDKAFLYVNFSLG